MGIENKSQLPIFLIAIDGHGGSGKSTLADLLARELGAEIIRTDDFAGWENPLDWWPLVIENVFEPIQNGAKTLSYERSKWWADHSPQPVIDQPVTPIMILEGVTALRKEFRPYVSYGIFVDTPSEMSLMRGFERDRGQDGKSDEEIRSMWANWHERERLYMEQDEPKEFADLVVRGDKPLEAQVFELLGRLK